MSQDELEPLSSPPESCPSAQQLCMPQFGIIHLLIWTAATAVLLKAQLAMGVTTPAGATIPTGPHWISQLSGASCAILLGAAVTALYILVRSRMDGMVPRFQPGHWILINHVSTGLLGTAWWVGCRLLWTDDLLNASVPGAYLRLGVSLFLYGFVAIRLDDTRWWRTAFGMYAVSTLLSGISISSLLFSIGASPVGAAMLVILSGLCAIVGFVAFLGAIIGDLRRKTRRDWLHWMGIAVAVAGFTLWVATGLLQAMMMVPMR